jgi:hypothetical protein
MSKVMRVKKLRKLVGISLAVIAISVSVASPAHASGADAAKGVVCEAAHLFNPSYYSDNCE